MALTPKNLYSGYATTGGITCYYVADTAGKYTIVKEVIIHNTGVVDVTLKLYFVPTAAATPPQYEIFNSTITAGSTVVLGLSTVMGQAAQLQAVAGANSAITLVISGVEA